MVCWHFIVIGIFYNFHRKVYILSCGPSISYFLDGQEYDASEYNDVVLPHYWPNLMEDLKILVRNNNVLKSERSKSCATRAQMQ